MPYTAENFKEDINRKLYSLKGKEQIQFALDLYLAAPLWNWNQEATANRLNPDGRMSKDEYRNFRSSLPQYDEIAGECVQKFFTATETGTYNHKAFDERLKNLAEFYTEQKVSSERKLQEQVQEPHSAQWSCDYIAKNLKEGLYAQVYRNPSNSILGAGADQNDWKKMAKAYNFKLPKDQEFAEAFKDAYGELAPSKEREAREKLSDEDKRLYDKANEHFFEASSKLDKKEQAALKEAEIPFERDDVTKNVSLASYKQLCTGAALDFVTDEETVKNLKQLGRDYMGEQYGMNPDPEPSKYDPIADQMDRFARQLTGSGKKDDSPQMAAVREQMNKVREMARSQGMNEGREADLKDALNDLKTACRDYMETHKGHRFTSAGKKRQAAVNELSAFLDGPEAELKDGEKAKDAEQKQKNGKTEKTSFHELQKEFQEEKKETHEKRRNSMPSMKKEAKEAEHVEQKGSKDKGKSGL